MAPTTRNTPDNPPIDPTQEGLLAEAPTLEEYHRIVAELRAARLELANQTQSPVSRRDPKVPSPPEFSGNVLEFRNFMSQCTLTFTMCPNTYVTDEHKVLFIISLLRGTAMTWAHDIPE